MAYGNFKPKQTEYNGVTFKSKLEARVAEALDALNIEWEYESRSYIGSEFAGGTYTPDFWLPEERVHVEVCGEFNERHRHQVAALAEKCPGLTFEDTDPEKDGVAVIVGKPDGEIMLDGMVGRCVECGKWGFRNAEGLWVCRRCGAKYDATTLGMNTNLFKAAGTRCYKRDDLGAIPF